MLLKAFYDNSFTPLAPSSLQRTSRDHSSEPRSEFKENIFGNCNQMKRDINININNELEKDPIPGNNKSSTDGQNLGNIIINSVDVSINVASKPSTLSDNFNNDSSDYGNNFRILCSPSSSPTSLPATLKTPDQQIVTSSSGEAEENCSMNNKWKKAAQRRKCIIKNEERLSGDEIDEDSDIRRPTRAATYSNGNENGVANRPTLAPVPDDILFDYHNIVRSYHGNKILCSNTAIDRPTPNITTTTSATNNHNHHHNLRQHSSREDDVKDYREERCRSSEMRKSNKHSSGDIKPITSTYLSMTRSMGLDDDDALNLVSD